MSTSRRITHNMTWLISSQVINKLGLLITTIIIARYFSQTEYGTLSYALSFTALLTIILDFGINNYVTPHIAKQRQALSEETQSLIRQLWSTKFFLAAIAVLIVLINILFTSRDTTVLIVVFAAYTIVNSFTLFLQMIFRAYEMMHFDFIMRSLEAVIIISATLLGTFIYHNINLIATGFIVAAILNLGLTIFFLRFELPRKTYVPKWGNRTVGAMVKRIWMFGLANIIIALYFQLDTMLIFWLRGETETAIYNAAYNISYGIWAVGSMAASALYPRFAYLSKTESTQLLKKYICYGLIVGTSGAIVIHATSHWLVTQIYGSLYETSQPSLIILGWVTPLYLIASVCGLYFAARGLQKTNLLISCIGLVVNIILNILFVPRFGSVGAATASFIAQATFVVCFVVYWIYNKNNNQLTT